MEQKKQIRVVVVGLGPIGLEVVHALEGHETAVVVGAADLVHAGEDLAALSGVKTSGIRIFRDASEAYRTSGGNLALLCTSSRIAAVAAQVDEAVDAGYSVVSTCEELAYPRRTAPDWAAQIDRKAQEKKVVVLGTGVNPGFVMDRLPLTLAAACVKVERVFVRRVVDAAKRRGPLRQKVGAGLTEAEFEAGVAARKLGHVGLAESVSLLASGLGFVLERVEETIKPVMNTSENRPGIEPGRVAGLQQVTLGIVEGEPRIRLDLEMSVGAHDPHDRVQITGDPPLDVLIHGGIQGDRATVGTVLSATACVLSLAPGLRTIADLPLAPALG